MAPTHVEVPESSIGERGVIDEALAALYPAALPAQCFIRLRFSHYVLPDTVDRNQHDFEGTRIAQGYWSPYERSIAYAYSRLDC